MILYCAECSSQNFVSAEREAVSGIPPRCWKCGEILAGRDETGHGPVESNKSARKSKTPGSRENE